MAGLGFEDEVTTEGQSFVPGQTVIYRPGHVDVHHWRPDVCLFGYEERGTVSSVRDDIVFVRFGSGSTAAGCRPSDLIVDGGSDRSPPWSNAPTSLPTGAR